MAAVTWDATQIPLNWLAQGYKEELGNKVLRTSVEEGPDKIRLLGTGETRTIQGRITLDEAQVNSLITFYHANATNEITITNPRNLTVNASTNLTVRFKEPPVVSGVAQNVFTVGLVFEVIS